MRIFTIHVSENDWDGYQFFSVSVQQKNEHNGIDILFFFSHPIPFPSARSMIKESVDAEVDMLKKLLESLGAVVEVDGVYEGF